MKHTLLIVEDDEGLQKYLKELLIEHGFTVHAMPNGLEALEQFNKSEPDLVLLDLGLPVMTGETVLQEIRKKTKNVPVVILTAKDSINDIVQGFDLGADDYVTKPFVADELIARINAKLRKQSETDNILKVGDLELDNKTLQVYRNGMQIQLTPQEFKLLHYLMSNKGRILTREMILSRIWMYSADVETRVVDVYMGYLRKKIDAENEKKLLHSIRGFGYVIKE